MVLSTFAPPPDDDDEEETTASRRATDLGRPLIVESAGISPSENTAMTLAASSPNSESLRGLKRIRDGRRSGEAAARSNSVSAPARTRAPLLRMAVSTISSSVHCLACRTTLLSSGAVALASTTGFAWLQASLTTEPPDEVELSERKRLPPPPLPLLARDDAELLMPDADTETIDESHLSERRREFGLEELGLGCGREEEGCDIDAVADANDADEAVRCRCSALTTACAISARTAEAKKRSTDAMSRQLSSGIRRRRMAKERSLFSLARACRLVSKCEVSRGSCQQLPVFVFELDLFLTFKLAHTRPSPGAQRFRVVVCPFSLLLVSSL